MFKKKPKKSNSRRFCENMLPAPNSQISEVLFELLANYSKGMTRLQIGNACNVLNVPEVIRKLRKQNTIINIDMINKVNKYGRKIKYGRYYLGDFKNGVEIYYKLTESPLKDLKTSNE